MLQSKEKREFIQSYESRQSLVLNFLHTFSLYFSPISSISPRLEIEFSPLTDIYGPSVVNPALEAIVVSLETLPGAKLINRVREEKSMRPLKILTVNRGSKYPLSSSFIRQYLHPCSVCNKHYTIPACALCLLAPYRHRPPRLLLVTCFQSRL